MTALKRILLAEDDQKDIELTLAALEEINIANKVDVVNNGEEALDYLFKRGKFIDRTTCTPAVVLLDLKMPKVDGLEVLKQIRESEDFKNIPVVILTSSKMESDLIESYRLGTNAFVIKPVEFEEFIKAIKRVGAFWGILNVVP
ncbi:response regulator [Thalassobellus citreus]|uniref:response regulator n=1 Tax=Thalassobellus citreus TaxID=3367752 RepID=UPI0037AAFBF9